MPRASRSGGFGGGGWNCYGYGSITGPYGNTYSRSYYGSGYYGGGFRRGYVSGPYGSANVGGVYRRPYWYISGPLFFAPQTALGLITSSKAALYQAQAKRSDE
jgi:hypothetical protein